MNARKSSLGSLLALLSTLAGQAGAQDPLGGYALEVRTPSGARYSANLSVTPLGGGHYAVRHDLNLGDRTETLVGAGRLDGDVLRAALASAAEGARDAGLSGRLGAAASETAPRPSAFGAWTFSQGRVVGKLSGTIAGRSETVLERSAGPLAVQARPARARGGVASVSSLTQAPSAREQAAAPASGLRVARTPGVAARGDTVYVLKAAPRDVAYSTPELGPFSPSASYEELPRELPAWFLDALVQRGYRVVLNLDVGPRVREYGARADAAGLFLSGEAAWQTRGRLARCFVEEGVGAGWERSWSGNRLAFALLGCSYAAGEGAASGAHPSSPIARLASFSRLSAGYRGRTPGAEWPQRDALLREALASLPPLGRRGGIVNEGRFDVRYPGRVYAARASGAAR